MPTPSTDRNTPLDALLFDEADERILAGDADVEVAVGGEDDAIDAAAHELLAGRTVGQLDPLCAVGRPACLEVGDRLVDPCLLVARGRRQHEPTRTRVDDDGDAIASGERVDQHAQTVAHERQLVGRVHRSRDVNQEHQIARRRVLLAQFAALKADERQLVLTDSTDSP